MSETKTVLLLPGPSSTRAARSYFGAAYEYASYLTDDYFGESPQYITNGTLKPYAGRSVLLWQTPPRFQPEPLRIGVESVMRELLRLKCTLSVVAVSEDDEQFEPHACHAAAIEKAELLVWAKARKKSIDAVADPAPVSRETKRGRPRSRPDGAPAAGTQIDGDSGSVFLSWQKLGLSAYDGKPPHANLDNIQKILSNHPDLVGRIWFDEFHGKIFQTLFQEEPTEWADHHDTRLAVWIQRAVGLHRIGHQLVQRAVDDHARRFPRNEVRDWMQSLVWDHQERLPTFMSRAFGAHNNAYTAAVGRCWMVSMVARTFEPGCKVDTMPVFEGAQGLRKSSAIALLGGKWYSEMHEDMTTKDFLQNLQGNLIIEISELHSFNRAEIDRIKAIVSCPVDRYRASYGRRPESHPRRGVWAGTTNRDDWNQDDTGARRFWPVRCSCIDLEWISRHREQLFAEAVYRYQAGESWWDIDAALAKIEQDARQADDVWNDIVLGFIDGKSYTHTREILCDALNFRLEAVQRKDELRITSILRRAGWVRKQRWIGNQNVKVWVFGASHPEDEL